MIYRVTMEMERRDDTDVKNVELARKVNTHPLMRSASGWAYIFTPYVTAHVDITGGTVTDCLRQAQTIVDTAFFEAGLFFLSVTSARLVRKSSATR